MRSTSDGGFGGVILAAGRSSRMGSPKALIAIDGEVIVDRLVARFVGAGLSPVVVVASGAVLEHLRGRRDLQVVEGDPAAPMISSLARGLAALPAVAGAVVQPVDAPFTSVEMIHALVAGFAGRSRVLTCRDQPGHPVLVAAACFSAIAAEPDGGLRRVLEAEPAEPVPFDDARIFADLDHPEDVRRWLGR